MGSDDGISRMIDPNASDWSDLDLLTTVEVTERLVAEIASVEAEIAAWKARIDLTSSRCRRSGAG